MIEEIRNPQGEKLDFRFHEAASPADANYVFVIGHGVTANLDRPWAKALAEGLAGAGIHALRFSFSGNGESEGDFRESCISKEVSDLGAVLDGLEAAGAKTSYAGHSMGGAVGTIRAAEDARILQFVSLAGMVETARFAEEEFGMETPDEGVMWEEPDLPLSSTFMNDLKGIDNTLSQAEKITVPTLYVHGSEDDLVPVSEAQAAFLRVDHPKKKIDVIEGANHVFGDSEEAMVAAVLGWLKGL